MDTEKLRVFCYLSELNSYVDVANKSGISRSNIKNIIASLEKDLDLNLTYVEGKKIYPTNEGKHFYKTAKSILNFYDEKIQLFKEEESKTRNVLYIHSSVSFANLWLPTLVKAYNEVDNSVCFNIIGKDQTPNFQTEHLDIVICPYLDNHEHLDQLPLKNFEMKLYASEEYIKRKGKPNSITELEDHDLIIHDRTYLSKTDYFNWYLNGVNDKYKVSINSGLGILQLVDMGMGIGPISTEGIKLSKNPLVPVLPELQSPQVEMFFIFDPKNSKKKQIEDIYNFLMKQTTS